jgi:methylated-DNA-[protein]-cysteine S-methyltransferase
VSRRDASAEQPPLAAYAVLPSPWGPVLVAASRAGVCGVELRAEPRGFAAAVGRRLGGRVVPDGAEVPTAIRARLGEAVGIISGALAGDATQPEAVPLDWTGVPAWDRRVLEGARGVARGTATGYGRLAARIGAPGAARAVGSALGRNPFWILVPCHRIVAGDGTIGGYGGGEDALELKRDLLALEGTALPVTRLAW